MKYSDLGAFSLDKNELWGEVDRKGLLTIVLPRSEYMPTLSIYFFQTKIATTTTATQKADSPSGASSGLATTSETNTSLNAASPNYSSLAPMLASGGINRPQPKLTSASTFEQIRRVPGNDRCADCGNEQPKWVSINLGVSFRLVSPLQNAALYFGPIF